MKIKISRDIKTVSLTLLFVFSIALTFAISRNIAMNGERKVSGETIKQSLVNISNLNTAEYYYTHVEPYNSGNRKIFWETIPVPNTHSEGVYSYKGVVVAGIDFSKIEVEVDKQAKKINILLPEASITDSHPDDTSLKTYYERISIFNPVTMITYSDLSKKVDEAEREEAIENGLLIRANENAKMQIESFVRAMYDVTDYKIVFETVALDDTNILEETVETPATE